MRTSFGRAASVAAVVMLFSLGCEKPIPPSSPGTAITLGDIPKCPRHPFAFKVIQRDSLENLVPVTLSTIVISGELTDVVEVHDCQRLIATTPKSGTEPASLTYGPTATIFASNALETMPTAPIRAVAAIYSWGETTDPSSGDYAGLGITGGWNCLYVFDPGSGPTARMVPARTDSACATRTANEGKQLRVIASAPSPDMKASDIPAVARWEWGRGPSGEANVIWIRCGDMACEIGPDGFKAEDPLTEEVRNQVLAVIGDNREGRRVLEFKGWYDQQVLAEFEGDPKALQVGNVVGTLIPWPNLGKLNDLTDFDTWMPVAVVYLPEKTKGYGAKLNMEQGVNKIFMRRGALQSGETMVWPCKHDPAADPWIAKVESASGVSKLFCVHRFEHSLPPDKMPGTVRWQWLEDDESTWIRCPKGCCPIG